MAKNNIKPVGKNNKNLLIFVAIFAVLGVAAIAFAGAAPRPKVVKPVYLQTSGAYWAKVNDPNVTVVQAFVNDLGEQVNVVQLQPGQQANFNQNRGGGTFYPIQTCYSVRSVGGVPATLVIVGGTAQKTVTTTVGGDEKLCAPYSTGSTYPGFDIKNVSGGAVNVYQKVTEFNL